MKGNLFGLHFGVSAVVCFYAVSGYAMAGLLQFAYPSLRYAPTFYLDRWLRLAPQYYFYLAALGMLVFGFGYSMRTLPAGPNPLGGLADLTILPLAFYPFGAWSPPTWTIGAELLFYLVLPFILINRPVLWAAAAISAAVWIAATHGIINSDLYGYRLLPGPLVFFLVGVAVQRRERLLYFGLCGLFAVNGWVLASTGKLNATLNLSLLVGAVLACIALPMLARLPRRKIDEQLGAASYGCYLVHWGFVITLEQHWGEPVFIVAAVVGSIICGWLSYLLVEAPTVSWRHTLRKKTQTHGHVEPTQLAAAPAKSWFLSRVPAKRPMIAALRRRRVTSIGPQS